MNLISFLVWTIIWESSRVLLETFPIHNIMLFDMQVKKKTIWIWSVQLSVGLYAGPEIPSSGLVSSVWFRCQLNKTFLVSLPDRRQLISTVPRTAVQPLCTTKKSPQKATHIENGRHHPRTLFKQRIPHQTQDAGKSVLKPAPLDLSGFHKYLNFNKDELKSFWKYAKQKINPAKAS